MKLKQIFLILTILIFANSCEKPIFTKKTIVEGTVTVEQTGEPLAGVTVTLKKIISERLDSKTIATFETDENGHYYYEFKAKRDTEYIVLGKSYSCYFFKGTCPSSPLEKEKTNFRDLVYKAKTGIVLHIKNVDPYDENDKIEIFSGSDFYDTVLTKIGSNIDFYYIYTKNRPFTYTNAYIYYKVTKNNQTKNYEISKYIESFCDYDTININY